MLAFDLKNEPRFGDLSLARYASPPPAAAELIEAFGERLKRTSWPPIEPATTGPRRFRLPVGR